MKSYDYDKLREFLKTGNFTIKVFDKSVSLETQKEYFNFAITLKKKIDKEQNYLPLGEKLFDPQTDRNEKKQILSTLASIENIDYYQLLEKFEAQAPDDLKEWAIMALYESRMLLESELLDSTTVYISSGLGGKNNSLRYFVVLVGDQRKTFTNTQFEVVKNEFEFVFNKNNGEVTSLSLDGCFIKVVCLLPYHISIRDCIVQIITECNSLGKFIQEDFILTNTKCLTNEEIEHFFKSNTETI